MRVFCMLLLTFCVTGCSQSLGGEVTVDCAAMSGLCTYRASGFINAISLSSPAAALVDPLKPQLFRERAGGWHWIEEGRYKDESGAFGCYERLKGHLGARVQVVVSGSHGYGDGVGGTKAYWPGDDGNWERWEAIVVGLVKKAIMGEYEFEWDIWNEPDHPRFWARDRDRFFETWRRTVNTTRSVEPNAVIVGPSIAHYDETYLKDFLWFAQEYDVLPTILCWHQWDVRTLETRVAAMRQFLSAEKMAITRICLNEIVGVTDHLRPGVQAQYFAAVERAEIDAAARGCWADIDCSGCFSNSLDGLLTPEKRRRATWWVYEAYAGITGDLLSVQGTPEIDGVAGYDPSGAGGWLVKGLLGRDGGLPTPVSVRLQNLSRIKWPDGSQIRVRAYLIPGNLYWQELARPVQRVDELLTVTEDAVSFVLPEFAASDAYFFKALKIGP